MVFSERDFEEYCLVPVGGKKLQYYLPCVYFVIFLLSKEQSLNQICLLGNSEVKTDVWRLHVGGGRVFLIVLH